MKFLSKFGINYEFEIYIMIMKLINDYEIID